LNEKSSGSRSRKQRLTAVGTRCADHVTPLYLQKLALTSPSGGGRSVGIVRVRTKPTELPPSIKDYFRKPKCLKIKLRNFLLEHSLYSLDEYFKVNPNETYSTNTTQF